MATRLALPSTLYSDVLGTLRQRKAAGQTVTPQDERSAWQSYWDTMALRASDVRRLGIQEGNLALNKKIAESNIALNKEQMALRRDEIAANKKAAIVSGVSNLGEMAALGGYVLKGTELGSKIGLGAATAPGVGETAAIGGSLGSAGAGGPAAAGGASAGAGLTAGGTAGVAGAGYVAGKIGAMVPIGEGKKTEALKSTASGAAAGAAIGTYVFPGVGTVAGGIIGGASGFLSSACIIVTTATYPNSYEVNIARIYRDNFMIQKTLRGYYALSQYIVPLMKNRLIKTLVRQHLVKHFVKYGEYVLGISDVLPIKSRLITTGFLKLCNAIGNKYKVFMRSNGEVY